MIKKYLKNKAIKLREKGYSYSLIVKKLGIGKSTLSAWLKEIPFSPNKQVWERIKNGPLKSGKRRHNEKVNKIKEIKRKAKKELGCITKRDLWMLGVGLYLGEGSKTYELTRVINSDPEIIKLSLRWFMEICNVPKNNIMIAIHIYPDNNEKACLTFWSRSLNLPLKQFRKTQIDNRGGKSAKKAHKLPYGTAHVMINSNGNPDFGVNLHRKIMGWLEQALESKK